jgi:hypothetical protein
MLAWLHKQQTRITPEAMPHLCLIIGANHAASCTRSCTPRSCVSALTRLARQMHTMRHKAQAPTHITAVTRLYVTIESPTPCETPCSPDAPEHAAALAPRLHCVPECCLHPRPLLWRYQHSTVTQHRQLLHLRTTPAQGFDTSTWS